MSRSPTDSASAACLERTTSAVLNVLVVDGCGIAVSGLVLGRRGWGFTPWDPDAARRWAYLSLIGLVFLSCAVRRFLGARAARRDPSRRVARFYWAHVLGAVAGIPAIPMGFAYGWLIRPLPGEIIPFWVVALALALLSIPRAAELGSGECNRAED